jgi:hypothetical protein
MDEVLQARIIAALLKRFRYVECYLTNATDLVLVASDDPPGAPDWRRLQYSPLDQELERIALLNPQAFALRRIGGREVLDAYVRMQGAGAGHSDFYPVVALGGPKARFLDKVADVLPLLLHNGMPVLDMVDGRRTPRRTELASYDLSSDVVSYLFFSGLVTDSLNDASARATLLKRAHLDGQAAERVLALSKSPVPASALGAWSRDLAVLARSGPGSLAPRDLVGSWIAPKWLAPGQGAEVEAVMAAYRATAERDAPAMRARALAVLGLRAPLALELRQQMLAIAMCGAAGQRDYPAVLAFARQYGGAFPPDDDYARIRSFLVAWAQPGEGRKS